MSCKKPNCLNQSIPRGQYCELHRTKNKKCSTLDCQTSSRSGSDKCARHGGGKRCNEPNCDNGAVGKTDKCKLHGGGKRCIEPDCIKSARGKTDKCMVHGGDKRCNEPNCDKGAQGKTDKCIEHGGGKRCNEPDCDKSALGKSDKCAAHGGGKRCNEPDCDKSAQGKTDKCIEHGGGKRCPHCIDWLDSRSGDSKYDGYCATCFKQVFPDDTRSTIIYQHTKEIRIRNAINQAFKGFVHDRPLYTGNCDCTHRRRVDHRKMIGNTMLAIETDEYAHQGYDKKDEEIRYDDLYMIHSGKWIFIRFNPDKTLTQKTDIEDRIAVLLDVIEKQIQRIEEEENQDLVEIIKLYY